MVEKARLGRQCIVNDVTEGAWTVGSAEEIKGTWILKRNLVVPWATALA